MVQTKIGTANLDRIDIWCGLCVAKRYNCRHIPQPDHDFDRGAETGRVSGVVTEEHVNSRVGLETDIVVRDGLFFGTLILRAFN